jgi:hypothetical protein
MPIVGGPIPSHNLMAADMSDVDFFARESEGARLFEEGVAEGRVTSLEGH